MIRGAESASVFCKRGDAEKRTAFLFMQQRLKKCELNH